MVFITGSVCDDTTITRSVLVPVKQWQRVESEMVTKVNDIQKLLFVAQHNVAEVEKLKEIADGVSDPTSAKYGKFMSYNEIYHSILPKTTANGHILEKWAKANGLEVTRATNNKQFIMVEASIDTIERVFQTKLQQYKHMKTGEIIWRSTSFELPLNIHNRMALINGLSRFPDIRRRKKIMSGKTQVLTNAPIIYRVDSGFAHYIFYIQLVCLNGKNASKSLCANKFSGFEISLSKQSKPFNVSVAEANCEVCSHTSSLTQYFCDTFSLKKGDVLCRFYLNQDDSVPLYEPHTFTIRTRFLGKFSKKATFGSAVEKVIDITPPVLRSLYNVKDSTTETRDNRSRQAVLGLQEYLDMKSFNHFANLFGKHFSLFFGKVYGVKYNKSADYGFETLLDLEYMASMGSRIPTDYISLPVQYDGFLMDFFVQLALLEENKANVVPLVYSISVNEDEDSTDASHISSFETQFMIMSLTGKTVFAASGDHGSIGGDGTCQNVFIPGYPSSSAYVTSVGGTQFVQATGDCSRRLHGYCLEEVAAVKSLLTGCRITSGGGFSTFVSSPKYQRKAVNAYLKNAKNRLPPDTYFNRSSRAYPDISLAGHQYQVKVFGNSDLLTDGTSASSPALAGLVSLIVDRRLKLGMQPLGLLNPLLYMLSTTHPAVFYDITKGNNSCTSSPVCCQYGFVAHKHWDPVTGLGSINHRMLMELLIKN